MYCSTPYKKVFIRSWCEAPKHLWGVTAMTGQLQLLFTHEAVTDAQTFEYQDISLWEKLLPNRMVLPVLHGSVVPSFSMCALA